LVIDKNYEKIMQNKLMKFILNLLKKFTIK
jgi:hypothetical protein